MNALRCTAATLRTPRAALTAWLVLVFIASSVPLPEGPEVDFPIGPDRILHGLAYAVLAALAVRALGRRRNRGVCVAAAVLGAVAYGALLEGWQHLIGRAAELGDVIANAIGATVGGLVAAATYPKRRLRSRNEQERSDHGHGGRSEAN